MIIRFLDSARNDKRVEFWTARFLDSARNDKDKTLNWMWYWNHRFNVVNQAQHDAGLDGVLKQARLNELFNSGRFSMKLSFENAQFNSKYSSIVWSGLSKVFCEIWKSMGVKFWLFDRREFLKFRPRLINLRIVSSA